MINKYFILLIFILLACSQHKPTESKIVIIDGEKFKLNYYEDGSIKSKVGLKKGKPHGYGYIFYESGKINHKVYWSEGKIAGHQFSYYDQISSTTKTTGPLKEYAFLDDAGEYSFSCGFESDGKLGYKKGSLVVRYDIQISDNEKNFYYLLQYAHLPLDSLFSKLVIHNFIDTLENKEIDIDGSYLSGGFTVPSDLSEEYYLTILTFYKMENAIIRDTTYLLRAKPSEDSDT